MVDLNIFENFDIYQYFHDFTQYTKVFFLFRNHQKIMIKMKKTVQSHHYVTIIFSIHYFFLHILIIDARLSHYAIFSLSIKNDMKVIIQIHEIVEY